MQASGEQLTTVEVTARASEGSISPTVGLVRLSMRQRMRELYDLLRGRESLGERLVFDPPVLMGVQPDFGAGLRHRFSYVRLFG